MTKDITNMRFGCLVAIRPTEIRKGNLGVFWECKCDCGSIRAYSVAKLTTSNRPVRSCGCSRRKQPKGTGSLRILYKNYKADASRRNYIFDIDLALFKNLTKDNCFYCGAEPSKVIQGKGNFGSYTYNGIDRIDNTKGYIPGNVVTCCFNCNRAKSTLSYNEFIAMCKNIAARH
jgi:hypothetical protein